MFDDFDDFEPNGEESYSNTDIEESLNKFKRIDTENTLFFSEEEIEALSYHFFLGNRFSDQLKIIEHGLYLYPNKVDFLIEKASVLSMDNRYQDSLEVIRLAKGFEPYNPVIHKMEGEILCDLDRNSEAEQCFRSALEHSEFEEDDFVVDIYVNYAQMLSGINHTEKANRLMEKALSRFPDNEMLFNQLSMNFIAAHQYDQAIRYFSALIDEKPYSHLAWYHLGRFYELTNRREMARQAYEYSGLANSNSRNAWFSLGGIHEGKSEYREAIEHYKQCIKNSGDLYPYICIARCYLGLEEGEMARNYLKKAASLEEMLPEYNYLLGYSYLTDKQALKALPFFRKIYKSDRNDFSALKGILSCYSMLERNGEIEAFYYRIKTENHSLLTDNWKEAASLLYHSECDAALNDLLSDIRENDEDREELEMVLRVIDYDMSPTEANKELIISGLLHNFDDTLESVRLFCPDLHEDEDFKRTADIYENTNNNEQRDI